ncbi:MAG: YheC/YheD family protein [Bacillaceae bacterium]|nr:YheC/YheD family protein [Bacillaceae bacterium]
MASKKYWLAASKWEKYQTLAGDPFIKQYLPETSLLNKQSFYDYLDQYPVVFLKPVIGTGGYGVIKIERQNGHYKVQRDTLVKTFKNREVLFRTLQKSIKNKRYIIQKGIDLITIQGRPVDFRILLLRPQNEWKLMGIMGKWAAPNKIVTNHCRGGKAITLRNALIKSGDFNIEEIRELEERLNSLGLQMAEILTRRFRYLRELGVDIALDRQKNVWVLEANTRPMFNLFRHHDNKKLFNKIYFYVKGIRNKYYRRSNT